MAFFRMYFTVMRDFKMDEKKKVHEIKKSPEKKENLRGLYDRYPVCLNKFRRCQVRNGERPGKDLSGQECSVIFDECFREDSFNLSK